jgi:radical SAM additional 4Fe4S-binding domain
MYVSKHTFRFSVDDGRQVLLFNPLTNSMDLIEKPSLDRLDTLCKNGGEGQLGDETTSYLLERGYLYHEAADEEAALRHGFEEFKDRERRSNMRFVILPTYQCNSRCPYCFIGDAIGQESLMNDETMDLAFAAIDQLAEERGRDCTKQLSLFGGEPLIDTPNQRRVVERILSKGFERGFLIDIVSNGFDLVHYVDMLKKYGVDKVQVTFDGMREYHNTRRRAVDKRGPSFDRIVAGVDAALEKELRLNVRVLLDRNSIKELPLLVNFFKEKNWFGNPNFTIHIGSVFDCFKCQPGKERAKHLEVREGNEALYKICREDPSIADLLEIDWQGVRRFLYTGKLFPPTYKTCFGGTRMFAFDMNGGIYACETTAGRPEYQIGTFAPTLDLNRDLMAALDDRHILNIPACQKCPQALLCAGGCSFNAVVNHGSLLSPGCRMLKETLQYGFDYYWPEIQERLDLQENGAPSAQANGGGCCSQPTTAPQTVKDFYAHAAQSPQPSLCCPTKYDPELIAHIPEEVLSRSYGCGSPAIEAAIAPADVVVDLGCGAGIDAFIAAKLVGPQGRVVGVDPTEEMIIRARQNAETVAVNLGHDITEFLQGSLERVPLEDSFADVVISNCVLNLSTNKPQAFKEIFRILKPGGRFVISDAISDKVVPEELRRDSALWNQCVSGALSHEEFVAAAREAGFEGVNIKNERPWKEVGGVRFYTAILEAFRPQKGATCVFKGQKAIYTGPLSSVSDDAGHLYPRGVAIEVCTDTAAMLGREPYAGMFLVLEPEGEMATAAACCSEVGAACC